MELRITRPAFKNAMAARGIDLSKATRQEMRTYVCAQCHVEYYFKGDNKVLTFPWEKGLQIDNINDYYDEYGFKDWTHKETGAPMLKMQHPEFEMFSTGLHYRSGRGLRRLPHALRARGRGEGVGPLAAQPAGQRQRRLPDLPQAGRAGAQGAHPDHPGQHGQLLRKTEAALGDAIDAIVAAKAAGATDEQLKEARDFHRKASMRWDFVLSENSTGFHSPQEAARVLANAIDMARQAQLSAEHATPKQ